MLKLKKIITVCLLIMFSFVAISPAYADVNENSLVDSGQYVENGILHEYVIVKNSKGELVTTSYVYDEDNNKSIDEHFVVSCDERNIYIDGELVATYGENNTGIAPMTIIDSRYNSGKYIELIKTELTQLQIAVTIASALISGVWTSIGVGLLVTVAGKILSDKFDTVFFEQYIILETFPEDRPGISVRETNKVRYYSDMYYRNSISNWITTEHEEI